MGPLFSRWHLIKHVLVVSLQFLYPVRSCILSAPVSCPFLYPVRSALSAYTTSSPVPVLVLVLSLTTPPTPPPPPTPHPPTTPDTDFHLITQPQPFFPPLPRCQCHMSLYPTSLIINHNPFPPALLHISKSGCSLSILPVHFSKSSSSALLP